MATKPAPAPSAGAPAVISDPAVPRLMAGLVERPRLFALLERGALGPVTLITAPAGSGKTMLLSSWLRSAELPWAVAWVGVERDETDATRFWVSEAALPRAASRMGGSGSRCESSRARASTTSRSSGPTA